jgi:hypothetical protein
VEEEVTTMAGYEEADMAGYAQGIPQSMNSLSKLATSTSQAVNLLAPKETLEMTMGEEIAATMAALKLDSSSLCCLEPAD